VSDFQGGSDFFGSRRTVAAAAALHADLLAMIVETHADPGLHVLGDLRPEALSLVGALPGDPA
jgi:hypothetical protein